MSKNIKISLTLIMLLALGLAGGVYWCWKIRLTPEARMAAQKEAVKTLRAAQGDEICAYLRKLAFERYFHTWFDKTLPYMHVAWETKVPIELIAQMTEESFLRFVGTAENNTDDIPHLKQMIAFTVEFLPECKYPATVGDLRERLLDARFLIGDYDGALAMLEEGMPGHDKGWVTAIAAKLRAHRAMALAAKPGLDADAVKKAKREAIENFTAYAEYMLSDAMKDFEDCDPSTGVVYSFEWVTIKNFMRSAVLAREIGDNAKAAELTARAKKYLDGARKKAAEDKKSSEAFEAEMKSYGL